MVAHRARRSRARATSRCKAHSRTGGPACDVKAQLPQTGPIAAPFVEHDPTLAREIARSAPQGHSRCGASECDHLLLRRRALPLVRERRSALRSEHWTCDPSTPSICLTPGGRYLDSVLRGRVTHSSRGRLRRSVRASSDYGDQCEMRCCENGSGDQRTLHFGVPP